MAELQRMAQAIAGPGMFGVKSPDQALALMLIAQAEGRHPATVAQEYDVIQGRPALKAQAALARFQAAGGRIQWLERTDTRASARFVHAQGGELEISWDMARAQAAGLTGKDNWRKFPAQMLSSRVISEGVRAVFPACLSGFYLAEEVADFDAPAKPRKAPPVQVESVQMADPVRATKLLDALDALGFAVEDCEQALDAVVDPANMTQAAFEHLASIYQQIKAQAAKDTAQ
jgi:hypothetical protein